MIKETSTAPKRLRRSRCGCFADPISKLLIITLAPPVVSRAFASDHLSKAHHFAQLLRQLSEAFRDIPGIVGPFNGPRRNRGGLQRLPVVVRHRQLPSRPRDLPGGTCGGGYVK